MLTIYKPVYIIIIQTCLYIPPCRGSFAFADVAFTELFCAGSVFYPCFLQETPYDGYPHFCFSTPVPRPESDAGASSCCKNIGAPGLKPGFFIG
jgi:hypothetical protein